MKMLLSSLCSHRYIIWTLAKNDFRARYLGSALGALWAFLLPLVNICIMWFAVHYGLRSGQGSRVPFILWLVTGMFPWAFFSEAVLNSSNSIIEKSFLVKKVLFQVEFLPIIKIIASLFPFLFFSVFMLLIFMLHGFWPDQYWLQIPYYLVCLCSLVLALSWLTSSIVVFYRDLGHIISVCLQLGFWVTPVFWFPESLPERFRFILAINPISYIITGYRNSLISKVWFWQEPAQLAYFWGLTLAFAFLGLFVFKKLRPHFADVL